MEYGIGTLADLFKHSLCSYENFLKDLEEQLLSQLETLKSILFYHRDIKPANIIITSDFKFNTLLFVMNFISDNYKNYLNRCILDRTSILKINSSRAYKNCFMN